MRSMERNRLPALLLALLMSFLLLAGCGGSDAPVEEPADTPTDVSEEEEVDENPDFSGTWVNENGDILRVDFENRNYFIQKSMEQGIRVGSGNTAAFGEEEIVYNGFKYGLSVKGDTMQVENLGRDSGYDNPGGADDTVDGPFTRDNSVEMLPYPDHLNGHWTNGEGDHLWMDGNTYMYENETTVSVGTLSGDGNGMGLAFKGNVYFFLSPDLTSFTLQPADALGEGKGVFTLVDDGYPESSDAQDGEEPDEVEVTEEEAMALMRDFIQQHSLPDGWIQETDVGVTDESVYYFELNTDGTWRAYWIDPDGTIDSDFYSEGVVSYVSKDEANTYTGEGGLVLAETGEFEGKMDLPEYDSESGVLRITFWSGQVREFVPNE